MTKIIPNKMVHPNVNNAFLTELRKNRNYAKASCYRALHFTGNKSVEEARAWLEAHKHDPDILDFPLVPEPAWYRCNGCGKKCRDYNSLQKHVKHNHSKPPRLAVCDDRNWVVSVSLLRRHVHNPVY